MKMKKNNIQLKGGKKMIISKKSNIETTKKILSILKDVKLPKEYYFHVNEIDIIEVRHNSFWDACYTAHIKLLDNNNLKIQFFDKNHYKKLKTCFEESKINFEIFLDFTLGEWGYN